MAQRQSLNSWLARLAMREFITEMADSLGSFSESQ